MGAGHSKRRQIRQPLFQREAHGQQRDDDEIENGEPGAGGVSEWGDLNPRPFRHGFDAPDKPAECGCRQSLTDEYYQEWTEGDQASVRL